MKIVGKFYGALLHLSSKSRSLFIWVGIVLAFLLLVVLPHLYLQQHALTIKHLVLVTQVKTDNKANIRIGQNNTVVKKEDLKSFIKLDDVIANKDIGNLERKHSLNQEKHTIRLLKANMSDVVDVLQRLDKNVNMTTVSNPHQFKYLINTNSLCKVNDLFILAYVHTAPGHFKRRMVIRQTWGNSKYYLGITIRLIFVMGKNSNKPSVQDALQFEADLYHDIIQEDFQDSYKNLTYKAIAALKWIDNNCRNAKFILKTDDDIFVNMFTLIRHLQAIDRLDKSYNNLLMCLMWNQSKVKRTGKWKVDKNEYKDDYYSPYCSGSAFVMTTDVAIELHNISYIVPFVWVDDFYITGLLPSKIGTIKFKQLESMYVLEGEELEEKFSGSNWFMYMFAHVQDLDAFQRVWQKLVKLATGKMSFKVKYALPGQLPNETHHD